MNDNLIEDAIKKADYLYQEIEDANYLECLKLAVQIQQNEILKHGFVVQSGVPCGLEAIAMNIQSK